MIGVHPSTEGIKRAREVYPHLNLHIGSSYEYLADKYGKYSVVMSLEVGRWYHFLVGDKVNETYYKSGKNRILSLLKDEYGINL